MPTLAPCCSGMAAVHPPRLPLEILIHILKIVQTSSHRTNSTQNLIVCSLVSKEWHKAYQLLTAVDELYPVDLVGNVCAGNLDWLLAQARLYKVDVTSRISRVEFSVRKLFVEIAGDIETKDGPDHRLLEANLESTDRLVRVIHELSPFQHLTIFLGRSSPGSISAIRTLLQPNTHSLCCLASLRLRGICRVDPETVSGYENPIAALLRATPNLQEIDLLDFESDATVTRALRTCPNIRTASLCNWKSTESKWHSHCTVLRSWRDLRVLRLANMYPSLACLIDAVSPTLEELVLFECGYTRETDAFNNSLHAFVTSHAQHLKRLVLLHVLPVDHRVLGFLAASASNLQHLCISDDSGDAWAGVIEFNWPQLRSLRLEYKKDPPDAAVCAIVGACTELEWIWDRDRTKAEMEMMSYMRDAGFTWRPNPRSLKAQGGVWGKGCSELWAEQPWTNGYNGDTGAIC
ncbi:hypothetical protein BC938DRAFT_472533 [Jimgerdemannia flammicorona]|uniref:Uncharacterized protein n=1 Tax=Jimgerdemannia flammicorona TaxID=994334 RepID=A0A433Q5W0_9FUNG|nr:hypothetical protein BC938DRAFT_472533 [Jimgerdemannia flammicorona]